MEQRTNTGRNIAPTQTELPRRRQLCRPGAEGVPGAHSWGWGWRGDAPWERDNHLQSSEQVEEQAGKQGLQGDVDKGNLMIKKQG